MSRDTAGEKLTGKPPGTFIIRFSDGEIGGVSIAWVHAKEGGSPSLKFSVISSSFLNFSVVFTLGIYD